MGGARDGEECKPHQDGSDTTRSPAAHRRHRMAEQRSLGRADASSSTGLRTQQPRGSDSCGQPSHREKCPCDTTSQTRKPEQPQLNAAQGHDLLAMKLTQTRGLCLSSDSTRSDDSPSRNLLATPPAVSWGKAATTGSSPAPVGRPGLARRFQHHLRQAPVFPCSPWLHRLHRKATAGQAHGRRGRACGN